MQAALRTCECLGLQDVWLIGQPHQPGGASARVPDAPSSPTASESRHSTAGEMSSAAAGEDPAQWLTIRSFATAQQCIAALREEPCTLWATDLSQSAETLNTVLGEGRVSLAPAPDTGGLVPDGPVSGAGETPLRRLAVAFSGSEGEGVSRELLDAADKRVYLPLHGGRHRAAVHKSFNLCWVCGLRGARGTKRARVSCLRQHGHCGGTGSLAVCTKRRDAFCPPESAPEPGADLICSCDRMCRLYGVA